jgi:hypothetical protein
VDTPRLWPSPQADEGRIQVQPLLADNDPMVVHREETHIDQQALMAIR